MKSYYQKLKDPRWQKTRLRIFERDKFTCQWCCATESTLAVHHLAYLKKGEPWEVDDTDLITLCDGCHEIAEIGIREFRRASATRCTFIAAAQFLELLNSRSNTAMSFAAWDFRNCLDYMFKEPFSDDWRNEILAHVASLGRYLVEAAEMREQREYDKQYNENLDQKLG